MSKFELPKEALAFVLKRELGVNSLYGTLQKSALQLLLGKGNIVDCRRRGKVIAYEFGIYEVIGKGDFEAEVGVGKGKSLLDINLQSYLKEYPKFAIYLATEWLSEKERRKLFAQLNYVLHEIRNYLWDKHLILENVDNKLFDVLGKYLLVKHVEINTLSHHLENLNISREVVVLDPYAEEELTINDIFSAKLFILGGIVDFGNRLKGSTAKLLKDVPHKKITLRGSIVGVPDRLNLLVRILLEAKYKYFDLEKAIKVNQPYREAKVRCLMELQKKKPETIEYFDSLSEWLNLRLKDFLWALEKVKKR